MTVWDYIRFEFQNVCEMQIDTYVKLKMSHSYNTTTTSPPSRFPLKKRIKSEQCPAFQKNNTCTKQKSIVSGRIRYGYYWL